MPQQSGGGTGTGGARARLRARIDTWEELRQQIADILSDPGSEVTRAGELAELRDQRQTINEQIQNIVGNHPGLYDDAVDMGYRADLLKQPSGGGQGSGSDTGRSPETDAPPRGDNAGNGGGGSTPNNNSGGGGGKDDKGGKGDDGGGNNDRLPGKVGKDYNVVTKNGKTYVMYVASIKGGKKIYGLFRVPDKLKDHYGVGKGRELTNEQWKRLKQWKFGLITDIKLNGKHPIRNFIEQTADKFGISPSFLRDRDIMETLLEAHLEKWDAARILGALHATDWYKSKTEDRIDWITKKSPAEREALIDGTYTRLKDTALTQFAGVNYSDFISDDQLKVWAKKVASGAIGWDEASAMFKLQQLARGAEGSAAWFQNQQATTAVGNTVEDKQAALRDDSIAWLGYGGRPDRDTLNSWAKELVAGTKSQADWDRFMRTQAQNIHRHLGDDEKFMDAQAAYRRMASEAFGRDVHPDDALLQDLSFVGADGTRDPEQRMSFQDFRRFMAKDERFWERGSMGHTQSTELASELASIFGGVNF